jgi:hypothetical protein
VPEASVGSGEWFGISFWYTGGIELLNVSVS